MPQPRHLFCGNMPQPRRAAGGQLVRSIDARPRNRRIRFSLTHRGVAKAVQLVAGGLF
jgi:hypothetical protein